MSRGHPGPKSSVCSVRPPVFVLRVFIFLILNTVYVGVETMRKQRLLIAHLQGLCSGQRACMLTPVLAAVPYPLWDPSPTFLDFGFFSSRSHRKCKRPSHPQTFFVSLSILKVGYRYCDPCPSPDRWKYGHSVIVTPETEKVPSCYLESKPRNLSVLPSPDLYPRVNLRPRACQTSAVPERSTSPSI